MRQPADLPAPALPLALAADLQDHLLIASNDLDRLQELLADASNTLMHSFRSALASLDEHRRANDGDTAPAAVESARQSLGDAVSALQFQDMTSQLVRHTQCRLRICADRIACETLTDDDGEAVVEPAPLAPNPVTQAAMDAGSVELF
jgi:hypothetical protein